MVAKCKFCGLVIMLDENKQECGEELPPGNGEWVCDDPACLYKRNCLSIPQTLEEAIGRIQIEMLHIMLSKRALRGTENITRQGLYGVATRMAEDKLARIQKSVDKLHVADLLRRVGMDDLAEEAARRIAEQEGEDSLEDDLIDTANYAIICLLLRRGQWELPTKEEA